MLLRQSGILSHQMSCLHVLIISHSCGLYCWGMLHVQGSMLIACSKCDACSSNDLVWCWLTVPRAEHKRPVWISSASATWPNRTWLDPALLSAAGAASLLDATTTPTSATTAAGAAASATAAAAVYSCLHSAGTGHLGKDALGDNGDQTAADI